MLTTLVSYIFSNVSCLSSPMHLLTLSLINIITIGDYASVGEDNESIGEDIVTKEKGLNG